MPDDIECHLVMCLTKPRLNYNGINLVSKDVDSLSLSYCFSFSSLQMCRGRFDRGKGRMCYLPGRSAQGPRYCTFALSLRLPQEVKNKFFKLVQRQSLCSCVERE